MDLIKGFKAKIRDKSNMPSWYYERLLICQECPNNSRNKKELSIKDKLRISHNLGKDACLICSCGITDIVSDPTVSCSELKPRWFNVLISNRSNKFLLENHSPSKGMLKKEDKSYIYNYGSIPYLSDTKIRLFLKTKQVLINFKVLASCGCTSPNWEKQNAGYYIEVSYDSSIIGHFEKQVSLIFQNSNLLKKTITFWIKGNIM